MYAACTEFLKTEAAKAQRAASQGEPQTPPASAPIDAPLEGKVEKGKFTLVRSLTEAPAGVGAEVKPGDTIITAGEAATVALAGGSRMEVAPNARVTLGDGTDAEVQQHRGRVLYDIKSRRMRVKVETPRGRYFIAVRGTQFTVDVAEDGSGTVLVTEGVVDVTSEGKTVAVQIGSSLTVRPGEVPSDPADVGGSSAPSVAVLFVLGVALLIAAGGAGLVVQRRRTQG